MSREVILWNRCLHWGLSLLCGESCICECGVIYDGILMRSLLVCLLHSVFSPRNRPYMFILMGVLILYQVWLWKLYLILENIALVITTSMSFLLLSYIQNLYVLMLEVLCWQGRKLDVSCQFLMLDFILFCIQVNIICLLLQNLC